MRREIGERFAIPLMFYLGLGLYIASFFLVAVGDARGYSCALLTLSFYRSLFHELIFYPGLINPLMIGFVVVKMLNEAPRLRRCLAIAALLLLIPTWLVIADMKIRLGCAMWVVSLPLITAEDLGTWKIRLGGSGQ